MQSSMQRRVNDFFSLSTCSMSASEKAFSAMTISTLAKAGQGDLREEVLLRDGPICAWCKKACNLWEVQVDHIKPYARFKQPEDADRLENLQVLCTEHHRAKTKTDLKVLSRVR